MADYYYRFPRLTDMTVAQQAALDDTGEIALSGGPGTGKSVVSAWRHINNYARGRRSLLLTYTHSLMRYLTSCCAGQGSTRAAENVATSYLGKPTGGVYDEVIVDEAQDLEPDYFKSLIDMGYKVSYGADDSQILYKNHCSTTKELKTLFPGNKQHELDRNFRCTQNIMLFAQTAFPNMFIPKKMIDGLKNNPGPKPVMRGGYIYGDMLSIIKQFAGESHNIGILVGWKCHVVSIHDYISRNGIDCSCYVNQQSGDTCPPLKNVHVTTYRSAKGLEFDTVILADFSYYYGCQAKPQYKEVLTEEDLYVAVTRARSNLYLLNDGEIADFRNRFANFIE